MLQLLRSLSFIFRYSVFVSSKRQIASCFAQLNAIYFIAQWQSNTNMNGPPNEI